MLRRTFNNSLTNLFIPTTNKRDYQFSSSQNIEDIHIFKNPYQTRKFGADITNFPISVHSPKYDKSTRYFTQEITIKSGNKNHLNPRRDFGTLFDNNKTEQINQNQNEIVSNINLNWSNPYINDQNNVIVFNEFSFKNEIFNPIPEEFSKKCILQEQEDDSETIPFHVDDICIKDNPELTEVSASVSSSLNMNPNPQNVSEYFENIYIFLLEEEQQSTVNPKYMWQQKDITWNMRRKLINWLVEVHWQFGFHPETLYWTVNILDRYLEKHNIIRTKLQLVGITAMFIACKYEEILTPKAKQFIYVTDKTYHIKELLEMEFNILTALEFNITIPSSYRFWEMYQQILIMEETVFTLSWFWIELGWNDYKMLQYRNSIIAATSCLLSMKIFNIYNKELLKQATRYSEEELKECARDICRLLHKTKSSHLDSVKNKFSLPRFCEVAKIKFV